MSSVEIARMRGAIVIGEVDVGQGEPQDKRQVREPEVWLAAGVQ